MRTFPLLPGLGIIAALAAGMTLQTGCLIPGLQPLTAYPVQGPLSNQKPLPVMTGTASGLFSGTLTLTLATGERCTGPWSRNKPITQPDGKTTVPGADHDLSSAWDAVYGPGFYVAHVLGSQSHVRAKLIGEQGAVIFAELYCEPDKHSKPCGVAQDTQGNTFKLTL